MGWGWRKNRSKWQAALQVFMSFDFILNTVDGLSLGSDLGGTGIDIHLKQVLFWSAGQRKIPENNSLQSLQRSRTVKVPTSKN